MRRSPRIFTARTGSSSSWATAATGCQYLRRSSPIFVPGPTRVSSSLASGFSNVRLLAAPGHAHEISLLRAPGTSNIVVARAKGKGAGAQVVLEGQVETAAERSVRRDGIWAALAFLLVLSTACGSNASAPARLSRSPGQEGAPRPTK